MLRLSLECGWMADRDPWNVERERIYLGGNIKGGDEMYRARSTEYRGSVVNLHFHYPKYKKAMPDTTFSRGHSHRCIIHQIQKGQVRS